ncbi:tail fiber domain-containing protein [Pseudoalteromonas sp. SCSIO 43088]|uniref:tail fiber domain-containing protein n=1 Tax=Pseudoalteromonas sp. SCSIO 43088 TaxID=2822846 RepID=UPI00202B45CD|nr:tail fiber domain-containing protein [Pseudoalteromonas sp. SCSIO 43088]URQ88271.1 tail fiber domain-containing protein [Pseudoalteromonas sp. SCSIO 43088]
MSAIKINGTWQRVSAIKVKKGGAWVDHSAVYAKLEGAWHLIDLGAVPLGPAYHVWKAYADDAQGTGISLDPTNKEYIGFSTGQRTEQPDLSDPSIFDWSLIKGQDGQDVDETVLNDILDKQTGFEKDLTDAESRLKAADAALANANKNLSLSLDDVDSRLASLKTNVNLDVTRIDEAITQANGRIDTVNTDVTASISAVDKRATDGLSAANASIDSVALDLGGVKDDVTGLVTLTNGQGSKIANLETESDEQAQRVSILETSDGKNRSRIASLETTTGAHASRLSSLGVWNGENYSVITSLEQADADNAQSIRTLEARGDESESRITTLEETDATHATRLSNVETKATNAQNRVSTLESTSAKHASRLTNVESKANNTASKVTTLEKTTGTHASRLTNVESKATTAVSKADAAQADADKANTDVSTVTNRVTGLEETSGAHASRLTNVETKATTAVNKANAAQKDADAAQADADKANADVSTVSNRVSTLESTSSTHANRLTNVETLANSANSKANSNSNRVSTLESTTTDQAQRITQVESVNLEQLATANIIAEWSGSTSITSSMKELTLESDYAGKAALRLRLNDAEGGIAFKLNGVELPRPRGADRATLWFDYLVDIKKGSNSIVFWQASPDGGTLSGVQIRGGDVGSAVKSLETASKNHAGRLTTVETTAQKGVDDASRAQGDANTANARVTTVSNRVTTLEETSDTHASRLTNVETKATTAVSKANAAQKDADAAQADVNSVTNRVSTLESTSTTHASRLTNVETKATSAVNKANAAQSDADAAQADADTANSKVNSVTNRVNTLESTSASHASRLTNVETKATSVDNKVNAVTSRVTTLEESDADKASRLSSIEFREKVNGNDDVSQFASMAAMSPRYALGYNGNISYGAFEDDTTIYFDGVPHITGLSKGDTGTINPPLGTCVESNKPLALVSVNGFPLPSTYFASRDILIASRSGSTDGERRQRGNLISLYGDAEVKFSYRDGTAAIETKSGSDTIQLKAGELTAIQFERGTNGEYIFASATRPIMGTGCNGADADHSVFMPLSREHLTGSQGVRIIKQNSTPVHNNGSGYYYSEDLFAVFDFGDGDGSASETGIARSMAGDTYLLPHDVHDLAITSPEPNKVKAYKLDGSLYKEYEFTGAQGGRQAEGTHSGNSSSPVLVAGGLFLVGEKPFSVRTNITTDEYEAVGYNSNLRPSFEAQQVSNTSANKVEVLETASAKHASRLTNVESKSNSNTNRVTTLESTSSNHASRLTSVESKSTSNTNRVSSLETTSNSHASRITSVESRSNSNSNRVGTLESTSSSHASRLSSVETLAASANGKANSNSNRVSSLETTTGDHASRLEEVETVNLEQLAGAKIQKSYVGNWAWTSNSTLATGRKFNLPCEYTGKAALRLKLRDPEGGMRFGINGVDSGKRPVVSKDNAIEWFEYLVDVNEGDNELSIWCTTTDGGAVHEIELRGGDVGSSVSALEQTADGHASRLSSVETKATTAVNKADNAQADANTANARTTTVSNRVSTLEETSTSHASRLSSVETKATNATNKANSNTNRVRTLESTTSSHASRLSSVESKSNSNTSRVSTLETTSADQAKRLDRVSLSSPNLVVRGVFDASLDRGGWSASKVVSIADEGLPVLSGRTHVLKVTTRDTYDHHAEFPVVVGDKIYISAWVYTFHSEENLNFGFRGRTDNVDQLYWPSEVRVNTHEDKWIFVEGVFEHVRENINGLVPFIQLAGSGVMAPAYVSDIVYSRSANAKALAEVVDVAKAYTDTETGVLKAERVIKAEANGRVSGVHLLADGSGAEAGGKMYFQADEIAIVPPNWNPSTEQDKKQFPFYFSEDRKFMYLDEAVIKALSAETIDSGNLAVDGISLLSPDLTMPAGTIQDYMIDPAFKDGLVRVNPDAEILGGTESVSAKGVWNNKRFDLPTLKSGGSAQVLTISFLGPNEKGLKDIQFDVTLYLNGVPFNFSSGKSTLRLASSISGVEVDGGDFTYTRYSTSFKFEDRIILPAPTSGENYTYHMVITNPDFASGHDNYASRLSVSMSASEPTKSSGGFITDVRWADVKEQPSLVGLSTAGSSSYPCFSFVNNPASQSSWIRTTSSGLLPYANNHGSLGTSSWKFKQVHGVTIYENGTALSSKYLGKSSKAVNSANSDKLGGLTSGQFIRSDANDTLNGHLHIVGSGTIGGNHANVNKGYLRISDGGANVLAFDGNEIACNSKLVVTAPDISFNGGKVWHEGNDGPGSGLNADMVDGKHASEGNSANTVPVRNGNGDIFARLFRSQYQNQQTISGGIAYRVSPTDNYIRFCNDMSAVRKFVSVYSKSESDGRYHLKTNADARFLFKSETAKAARLVEYVGTVKYGRSGLTAANVSGAGGNGADGNTLNNPTSDWWYHLTLNHQNSAGYYFDIACSFHNNDIRFKRVSGGVHSSWYKIWTSADQGSGSGLDADKVDGVHLSGLARIGTTSVPDNFLYVQRSSNDNAAAMYVNQRGDGDIARFVKGTTTTATDGDYEVAITSDAWVDATGGFRTVGAIHATSPLNTNVQVALQWSKTSNEPRLRVGGSGTGADAAFNIQTVGDANFLRVDGTNAFIGRSKHRAWHTGNDSTLRGLKLTNYKNITVGGDANTYYPVLITGSAKFMFGHFSINRGYGDVAPDTWNTASHKGGLTFDFYWSGDSGWGGNDHDLRVIQFSETYSTMVGGMVLATSGLVVWLRGGGAVYRIHSEAGNQLDVTAYIGTYTASNGSNFPPRTNTNNVRGEIFSRWPVRTDGKLAVIKGLSVGLDNETVINGSDTWYRAHNDEGLYFATYGGGLHMTDSTWIRTYNGRSFYCSSNIKAAKMIVDSPNNEAHFELIPSNNRTARLFYRGSDAHFGLYMQDNNNNWGTRVRWSGDSRRWTFYDTAYAPDFIATSDRRVKSNIKPIENALEKVMKLSGNTYTRDDLDGEKSAGVIAQEVEEVLPEVVKENEGLKRVAHNGLIGLLVEAVKELTAKVKVLEAR